MRDTPPALTSFRGGLPEELTRIVARCLEKDPAARFQSMKEVHGALDALAAGGIAAIGRDPPAATCSRAGCGRARSEIWSFVPGSLALAISHLEAALRLIGDNALLHQGLGAAYFSRSTRGDIHGCGRSFRRVLQASPKEIVALQLYTHALGWLGGSQTPPHLSPHGWWTSIRSTR